MNIYTTLQKGYFHTHYCEDFLIVEKLSNEESLIAVMDGCSMGKESVFASNLYGKILRTLAKKIFYRNFVEQQKTSESERLKDVIGELFKEINTIKKILDLDINELLSTLILGIVNKQTARAEIIVIGDGLVSVDDKFYEFEQNDKPDYLGYHLNENFESWYEEHNQFVSIDNFNDLSISTDGIYSFKNLKNKANQKDEIEVIEFMLINDKEHDKDNFLGRKIRVLEKENHLVTDDLAIIRLKK